jgi:hypothetical protein
MKKLKIGPRLILSFLIVSFLALLSGVVGIVNPLKIMMSHLKQVGETGNLNFSEEEKARTAAEAKHMDDEPKLDVGKLAIWRLQTRNNFGGVWLSDYLPNRLGLDTEAPAPKEKQKPQAPLLDADGNIYNLLGIAARTLKRNGMAEEAKEMQNRVTSSHSYDEALAVIFEYVEPVGQDEMQGGGMEMRM